jgi:hypothetical protein
MSSQRGDRARILLGGIRLVNVVVAFLAPWLIIRRFGDQPGEHPVSTYALRMFGIRTILIGLDLLRAAGPERANAMGMAPIIHASDTVAAVLAVRTGKVPMQSAVAIVVISGLNTVLSLVMHGGSRRRS